MTSTPLERVRVAIVGAGPAGLSAGCRAAARGVAHVVLERSEHLADTVFQYQKGKHVMATPDELSLRSDAPFAAGRREDVLGAWQDAVDRLGVRLRTGAEVVAIHGEPGALEIELASGERIVAEAVVLAIGLQGNVRTLRVPGAELPIVQYTLSDPDAYHDEHIVIVGAGDSAIENAVALAAHNDVTLLNRRDEFARAKPGNLSAIRTAQSSGEIEVMYDASPAAVEPEHIVVKTAEGTAVVPCDRIIARIGATPPRGFLERLGIALPSADAGAVPELSERYESNRPGIFIIGALAGYPLIKHCMNQGYEVVEHILGHAVEPADAPLLTERIGGALPGTVSEVVDRVGRDLPLLAPLTRLQLRELLLDSNFHRLDRGDVVFERGDWSDELFCVVTGSVDILVGEGDSSKRVELGAGEFFGEGSLLSGRPRSATVVVREPSVLLQTQRRAIIKLKNNLPAVQRTLDEAAMVRLIQANLTGPLHGEDLDRLREMVHRVELREYDAGEELFHEGDAGDGLYLIRKGSVTVSRASADQGEIVVAYVPAGAWVGEMALLDAAPRRATVRATIASEALFLHRTEFDALLELSSSLRQKMQALARDRLMQTARLESDTQSSGMIRFMMEQGLGEATDVLLIDEALCVACDNCEVACASTHGGTSRLDRAAGPSWATLHVPTSCRHCEDPKCMTDCPPNAIHRSENKEVWIDDTCIGCGNCEANCPYDVIHMATIDPRPQPSALEIVFPWLSALLRRRGPPEEEPRKVATKCDMCRDLPGGPACVAACPTGAALRVSPKDFIDVTQGELS